MQEGPELRGGVLRPFRLPAVSRLDWAFVIGWVLLVVFVFVHTLLG